MSKKYEKFMKTMVNNSHYGKVSNFKPNTEYTEDKLKSLVNGGVVWIMDEAGVLSTEAVGILESRVPRDEKLKLGK